MEIQPLKSGGSRILACQHSFKKALVVHRQLIMSLSGGIFLAAGLLSDRAGEPGWATAAIVFYILSYAVGGFYKAKEGLEDLIQDRALNVEMLMILAALGAASIGYWSEGAILIFIFSLSGALETYTWQKSEKDLSSLVKLAPLEANRVTAGEELETVPVDDLLVGDRILIRSGERVPADGVVVRGSTSVDESAITGEPVPVDKDLKDEVYNGTMNGRGSIVVEVTKENANSLFQKMIGLVEQAKSSRPPAQQFIEKVEGPYVITVLIVVALMLVIPPLIFTVPFQETFYRAMVLLVVASPCAVVASVMPALLSAISNGARRGVLMKGGTYLEQLSKASAVALDKTGTITKGEPAVTDFCVVEKADSEGILKTVAAVEAQSNHPLARAITAFVKKQGISGSVDVESIEDVTGYGVKADIGTAQWKIGNLEMMTGCTETDDTTEEEPLPETIDNHRTAWQADGKTVVYVSKNGTIIASLAIKDEIRPEAKQLIDDLHDLGIKTIMITGDHESTAASIAAEAGLDDWVSQCLPERKVTEIDRLKEKYGSVVMVGDGINDAPAMAKADIGIAMGSGTDVAIDTADMVLMKSELEKISLSFKLSKRLNRIVAQNLIFSISVILILIAANFAQQLTLPLGVIGHEGSTILVILNGLRLLR
ncbi:heavy metal translocating P-type ATPase [Salipaludibacillus aurantiacus]|uniref:Cd2+/Zn2+-exporting ATPase n=1 Tax=Salipaludibacillus aurantiacus TaxID=1601833 RepID=A0A1H9VB79_9BACI|nr:heavy metal translocating P-type ATPase [Salipaludibacillus aurantiacus]SES19026.1 Cd2+/Zn2+-exporting ATPase [Salipaludibacillus aurantiacus]